MEATRGSRYSSHVVTARVISAYTFLFPPVFVLSCQKNNFLFSGFFRFFFRFV